MCIRDSWDSDAQGHGNTLADFTACCATFILRYMTNTDFADQQTYLDTCKKPYKMTVGEVSARLEFVNNLMAFFPGGGGNAPYDNNALKYKLFKMMLPEWRNTFAASGTSLADAGYTLRDLTLYMSIQEQAYNQTRSRVQNTRGGGRDCSRGGGGRGNQFGRHRQNDYTYNRNVRPRYNNGNYHYGGRGYGAPHQYTFQGRGNYPPAIPARGHPPARAPYNTRLAQARGGGRGGGRVVSPGHGRDNRGRGGQRDGRGGRVFSPRREAYVADAASNEPPEEDQDPSGQDEMHYQDYGEEPQGYGQPYFDPADDVNWVGEQFDSYYDEPYYDY